MYLLCQLYSLDLIVIGRRLKHLLVPRRLFRYFTKGSFLNFNNFRACQKGGHMASVFTKWLLICFHDYRVHVYESSWSFLLSLDGGCYSLIGTSIYRFTLGFKGVLTDIRLCVVCYSTAHNLVG